jgi:hypothetical protein
MHDISENFPEGTKETKACWSLMGTQNMDMSHTHTYTVKPRFSVPAFSEYSFWCQPKSFLNNVVVSRIW